MFNSIFTPKTKQNGAASLKKNSSSRKLLSPKGNSYKDNLIFIKREVASSALETTQSRKTSIKPNHNQFTQPSMKTHHNYIISPKNNIAIKQSNRMDNMVLNVRVVN